MATITHTGASPPRRATRSRWLRTDNGQGLVEYALILVLVAIVVIGILSAVGTQTSQVLEQVNCTLAGGKQHQDNGNGNSNKCE